MKFILDKDKLTIVNNKPYTCNSGSIDYYESEVQFDESWNDLIIEAIITKMGEEKGISRSPINNKIMLDLQENGTYTVGFVGYKIENEEKIYQISTNLDIIQYEKGAGEIETENEPILTPTEWEIYIAQIQEMLEEHSGVPEGGTTGQVLAKKSNQDGDVEWVDKEEKIYRGSDLPENNVLIWIDTSGTTPTYETKLLTKNNETFITKDDKNFILKEES